MNFPMPDFKLGMPIQRWAEQLREWAKTMGKDITVLKGDKGERGDKGDKGDKGDPGTFAYNFLTLAHGGSVYITDAMIPGVVDVGGSYTAITANTYIYLPVKQAGYVFELFVKASTVNTAPYAIRIVDDVGADVVVLNGLGAGTHGHWYTIACTNANGTLAWKSNLRGTW